MQTARDPIDSADQSSTQKRGWAGLKWTGSTYIFLHGQLWFFLYKLFLECLRTNGFIILLWPLTCQPWSYIFMLIGTGGHVSGLRMKAKVQIVTLTWFWSRSELETKACSVLRGHSSSTVLCLSHRRQIDVLQPPSCEWLVPCAILEKLLSSPTFFPRDKLVSADNGEAVMAQREPQKPRRVFVLPGTFFDTGFGPWTQKHGSLEMQDQAERFAFRVLILWKQLLRCVGAWGNSDDVSWSCSWATAVITENMNLSSFLQIWTNPHLPKQRNRGNQSPVICHFYSFPGNNRFPLHSFSTLFCILGRGSCWRSSRSLDVDNRPEIAEGWYHLQGRGFGSQTTSTSSCVTAKRRLQLRKKGRSNSRQILSRTVCSDRQKNRRIWAIWSNIGFYFLSTP